MDRRIKALLVVQVIALPLVTALASNEWGPHPAPVVLVSLVFSEAGLLGLWAALGKSRAWVRLPCTVVGLSCLTAAILIAQSGQAWPVDLEDLLVLEDLLISGLVVAVPAFLVFLVLQILQRIRGLRLVRSPPLQATSEGIQFSIKHLMAATAIIAAIVSIREGLKNFGFGYGGVLWTDLAIIVAIVIPCVLLVELATFWAALGLSRPLLRLMVVIPSGFLVGIVPPFFIVRGSDWQEYALWSGITGLQAFLTAATLLVFRSSGWRLCRAASDEELSTTVAPEESFETTASAQEA